MKFRIIESGSKGNAVLYDDFVLVDCGVSYSKLSPYVHKIKVVLLTHEHSDHFNLKSLSKLSKTAKIICCDWLSDKLGDIPHSVIQLNKWYDLGSVKISALKLYHDVSNCGYRILINNEKALHCTDTSTLDGIEAIGYQIYAIEHNYDGANIYDVIDNKIKNHEYAHEIRSLETHLSFEEATRWINKNAKNGSKIYKLHMSDKYTDEEMSYTYES